MDAPTHPTPDPPPHRPLEDQLPWDVHAEIARNLRDILPPPEHDTQESLARRDRAAIAIVASLVPVTAAESNMAADYLICSEQSKEAFRIARAITDDPDDREKKLNWALRYLGKANACMASLLRMQAERRKREATPKGAMYADATVHNVVGYLAAALGYTQDTNGETWEPEPPPEPEPEPEPPPEPTQPKLTEGEYYAAIHPKRAKAIREYGGMPPHERFGPPPRAVINELLRSQSPRILAVDDA